VRHRYVYPSPAVSLCSTITSVQATRRVPNRTHTPLALSEFLGAQLPWAPTRLRFRRDMRCARPIGSGVQLSAHRDGARAVPSLKSACEYPRERHLAGLIAEPTRDSDAGCECRRLPSAEPAAIAAMSLRLMRRPKLSWGAFGVAGEGGG